MKIFTQSKYHDPTPKELKDFGSEPLTIHKRPEPSNNETLIIFVHGLGGCRYGKNSTFGYFPKYLYEDLTGFDIGFYEYVSLFGRFKFWKSVEISEEAETFAGCIRQIKEYKYVILIGHSLGGVLSLETICNLIRTDQKNILPRIRGLIMMGTPQTGSPWVKIFFSWLSNDLKVLEKNNKFLNNIHETLLNHKVYFDETIGLLIPNSIIIPTWAVIGDHDFWVDKYSAAFNVPKDRRLTIHGSHTEIVKPRHKQHDGYRFIKECLEKCYNMINQIPSWDEFWIRREIGGNLCYFNVKLNDLLVASRYGVIELLEEYRGNKTDEKWKAIKERAKANHEKMEYLYGALCELRSIKFFGENPRILNDIQHVITAKGHEFYWVLEQYPETPKLTDQTAIEDLIARARNLQNVNKKVIETQDEIAKYIKENHKESEKKIFDLRAKTQPPVIEK